jgi:hypothetical protein
VILAVGVDEPGVAAVGRKEELVGVMAVGAQLVRTRAIRIVGM